MKPFSQLFDCERILRVMTNDAGHIAKNCVTGSTVGSIGAASNRVVCFQFLARGTKRRLMASQHGINAPHLKPR